MRKTVIALIPLALVVVAVGVVLNWEYTNQLGIFRPDNHTRVVVFDAIHGEGSRRVLVSSGNCIFTVGEEYAWVEEDTPYLVSWYLTYANAKSIQHLVSIKRVGG